MDWPGTRSVKLEAMPMNGRSISDFVIPVAYISERLPAFSRPFLTLSLLNMIYLLGLPRDTKPYGLAQRKV